MPGVRRDSADTRIVMEEIMVPSSDPGIEIYVRNKRPAEMTSFRPERTLLYVHGATYPSETAFDLKLDGLSWMEYIASRGYDVWLLDLRGYGKSTRPAEMADKPEANPQKIRERLLEHEVMVEKMSGEVQDVEVSAKNADRLTAPGQVSRTASRASRATCSDRQVSTASSG